MLYILLFLAAVASDQWLKYWTVSHLELGEAVPFIPHILQLRRLHNYGAAWSSLSGKTVLLVAFTAVLEILVRILVILKLLYEVSVCLDEEVSVTAADPKQCRLLAEVCLKFLVEILVHR